MLVRALLWLHPFFQPLIDRVLLERSFPEIELMPESKSETSSSVAFIRALFASFLKRAPAQPELEAHLESLKSGTLDRSEIVASLLRSDEFKRHQRELYRESAANGSTIAHLGKPGKTETPYEILEIHPSIFDFPSLPYMSAANCLGQDFLSEKYKRFCAAINNPPSMHRKLWEFAFIFHHLEAKGVLRPGGTGVGFGVGVEPLPSLFASLGCTILATDAPPSVADPGWERTSQHSNSKDQLYYEAIVEKDKFDKQVSFAYADMNAIPEEVHGFDFCWSSCCFEHLGSIGKGLDFVEYSVEKVIKSGGVACHTSELNLSSNEDTLEGGATVLFRRRDIEGLIDRLEKRGHRCERLPIVPPSSFIDYLVDVPPYSSAHLKMRLGAYVTTSFGVTVTRGR